MSQRITTSKLLALPVAGVALVSHHTFDEGSGVDLAMEFSGFALLVFAALGRLWSSSFICGRKNAELVTDGPYSLVRNPLYFFSFFGFVGAGLAFESITLAAVFGGLFFLTHWPTILREERRLVELFGDSFKEYSKTVPRFWPHSFRVRMPPTVTISPRLMSRAIAESMLVLCIFPVAELTERIHLAHPQSVLLHIP